MERDNYYAATPCTIPPTRISIIYNNYSMLSIIGLAGATSLPGHWSQATIRLHEQHLQLLLNNNNNKKIINELSKAFCRTNKHHLEPLAEPVKLTGFLNPEANPDTYL